MTHDDLVKFAADKVGWKAGFKDSPIYGSQWYQLDMEGHIIEPFTLSSPDLMLKGMGVAIKAGMEPFFEYNRVGFLDTHDQYGGVLLDKNVEEIDKMPERFWYCWAELEGGQGWN